uniref:NADH dehydrogenase subunit 1 n=1 Tax=Brueelia antiqua TaxID=580326 RepID=UPI00211E20B0|nr:NADH dehydrogenase subunit 1 [Brueelia antiqua]UTT72554.1 NADH dehydrogenase subunit 1 [Brueelia antiqua]
MVLVSVLLSSGFFTLFERKVMGSVQFREGPSKVIVLGFFQPVIDALKLFSKTNISSEVSVDFVYFFSPFLTFFVSLICWIVFPLVWGLVSWYSSMVFILFCFSVSVYGIIFSGWFSRSKFASLGCVRALCQSLSYEIPLSTILFIFMLVFSSFSLKELGEFQEFIFFFFPFMFLSMVSFVVFLAEMNRSPFDLAEGESELVSGFSVELGGASFVAVFLGEYISLTWISVLVSLLFFGEVNLLFGVKVLLFMFMFAWVRSSVPRVRFDNVMISCWLVFLPLVFVLLLLFFVVLFNQSQSTLKSRVFVKNIIE